MWRDILPSSLIWQNESRVLLATLCLLHISIGDTSQHSWLAGIFSCSNSCVARGNRALSCSHEKNILGTRAWEDEV